MNLMSKLKVLASNTLLGLEVGFEVGCVCHVCDSMGMYGNSICSSITVAGGLLVAILSYIFCVWCWEVC